MSKRGAQGWDRRTFEAVRLRAVEQISSGRVTVEQFADSLGLAYSTVYGWMQKWRAGGVDALASNPAPGRAPALSEAQQRELVLLLRVNPMQLEFDFGLWTRRMVRELISRRFGVDITVQSVGNLLRRLGLSPQRPLYRAYEADPEAVRRWEQEEYPAIRAEAQQAGAIIYFADEASVRSDFHSGTTWATIGETPTVRSTGGRFTINMISAVTSSGRFRFSVFEGTFNSDVLIDFLRRLTADEKRPVYVILDGHSVHHSKRTKEYVASTNGKLKIFQLPGYSPQLNPDEHVWKNLKRDTVGRIAIEGREHFKAIVTRKLHSLQRLPRIIQGFFHDPHLAYING